jgi:hypothetical protein
MKQLGLFGYLLGSEAGGGKPMRCSGLAGRFDLFAAAVEDDLDLDVLARWYPVSPVDPALQYRGWAETSSRSFGKGRMIAVFA